jgi:hypothetical protein
MDFTRLLNVLLLSSLFNGKELIKKTIQTLLIFECNPNEFCRRLLLHFHGLISVNDNTQLSDFLYQFRPLLEIWLFTMGITDAECTQVCLALLAEGLNQASLSLYTDEVI